MALLNKIFNRKKDQKASKSLIKIDVRESPEFREEQVRVLLLRDSETNRKKILYDSQAVQRVPISETHLGINQKGKCHGAKCKAGKQDGFVEVTDGYGYQYLRPISDVRQVYEMVFGSIAMAYKGSTMKLHPGSDPPQLMLSKIFPAPRRIKELRSSSDWSVENSCTSSIGSFANGGLSRVSSVDSCMGPSLSGDMSSSHGSSIGPPSLSASTESSLSSINGSCASWSSESLQSWMVNRRLWRHMRTSMDHGTDGGHPMVRRDTQDSMASDNGLDTSGSGLGRLSRLAISLVISLDQDGPAREHFERFFYTNLPAIECLVMKLQLCVERAYSHSTTFVHSMYEGVNELIHALADLYTAPRISRPLWVLLHQDPSAFPSGFMQELGDILARYDVKETNFFVSTLLSAVLTHHLGWVLGFSPKIQNDPNPVLSQMEDLHGICGFPPRHARTLVIGHIVTLVQRIVYLLTYFVRCEAVSEHIYERVQLKPSPSALSVRTISSTSTLIKTDSTDNAASLRRTVSNARLYPRLEEVEDSLDPGSIAERVQRLCRVNGQSRHMRHRSADYTIVTKSEKVEVESAFDPVCDIYPKLSLSSSLLDQMEANKIQIPPDKNQKVVFVLGENERLELVRRQHKAKKHAGTSNVENGVILKLHEVPEIRIEEAKHVSSAALENAFKSSPAILNIPVVPSGHTDVPMSCTVSGSTGLSVLPKNLDQSQSCCCRIPVPVCCSCTKDESQVNTRSETLNSSNICQPKELERPHVEAYPTHLSWTDFCEKAQKVPIPDVNYVGRNSSPPWMPVLSLFLDVTERFVSGGAVSGTTQVTGWESSLKRDLLATSQCYGAPDGIAEAVCILGNTSNWSVEVMRSNSGSWEGGQVGSKQSLSPLVAAILDSLQQLWKARVPAQQCLEYLEAGLREIYLRSRTLADYLLADKFSDMGRVTRMLKVEVADVPLLLAAASTHSPQVTRMYGISHR
ncbi:unnamed protein product [Darwinula stevensoni]|uniref:UDENN FNIP1/2-type domain-containing protein n=1 Tax=Darwinula stevensoni TaxID=69355 RepID=A0A7R9A4A6_9CRUS|nr:unnamed protein product [Darwinula stevensoni]CAG0889594.1 unnamed protein product [Darwinula stevensoni]